MTIPTPERRQAQKALLLAPLFPVAILFIMDAGDRTLQQGPLAIVGAAMLAFYILVFVEFFTILFGGMALALLWRRVPFNLFLCAFIGGLVAALPFLIYWLMPSFQEPFDYNAWVDGQPTVVDGVKTAYGRLRDFISIIEVFALGLIGGAFFWWLCRPKRPRAPEVE
jgi:hypothetical protein